MTGWRTSSRLSRALVATAALLLLAAPSPMRLRGPFTVDHKAYLARDPALAAELEKQMPPEATKTISQMDASAIWSRYVRYIGAGAVAAHAQGFDAVGALLLLGAGLARLRSYSLTSGHLPRSRSTSRRVPDISLSRLFAYR